MRKTSSNRRLSPPPWGVVAEDRPTGNNSRHDRGLREAPRTPRVPSSLSAPAVCRAVTEQTVGPFWVQARRVEPACSSRTAGLAPPPGAPSRPDNPHAVNRSSRSVGDVNRSRRGPRCAFLPYSFLPCLISPLVSLALPYLPTLPHLHRTLSSHPGSMSHSYGPTTVLGHTVEAYFNREYDVRKQ